MSFHPFPPLAKRVNYGLEANNTSSSIFTAKWQEILDVKSETEWMRPRVNRAAKWLNWNKQPAAGRAHLTVRGPHSGKDPCPLTGTLGSPKGGGAKQGYWEPAQKDRHHSKCITKMVTCEFQAWRKDQWAGRVLNNNCGNSDELA